MGKHRQKDRNGDERVGDDRGTLVELRASSLFQSCNRGAVTNPENHYMKYRVLLSCFISFIYGYLELRIRLQDESHAL